MKKTAKIDITIIMLVSLISAILYIALEGIIMDYGRELSNPLLLGLSSFLCKFLKKIYGEGNLPLCIASDFIELLY